MTGPEDRPPQRPPTPRRRPARPPREPEPPLRIVAAERPWSPPARVLPALTILMIALGLLGVRMLLDDWRGLSLRGLSHHAPTAGRTPAAPPSVAVRPDPALPSEPPPTTSPEPIVAEATPPQADPEPDATPTDAPLDPNPTEPPAIASADVPDAPVGTPDVDVDESDALADSSAADPPRDDDVLADIQREADRKRNERDDLAKLKREAERRQRLHPPARRRSLPRGWAFGGGMRPMAPAEVERMFRAQRRDLERMMTLLQRQSEVQRRQMEEFAREMRQGGGAPWPPAPGAGGPFRFDFDAFSIPDDPPPPPRPFAAPNADDDDPGIEIRRFVGPGGVAGFEIRRRPRVQGQGIARARPGRF